MRSSRAAIWARLRARRGGAAQAARMGEREGALRSEVGAGLAGHGEGGRIPEVAAASPPGRSGGPAPGKPAQCLIRRKRSSSTPATKRPSATAAAEASAWKAERPRMRLTAFSLSRRAPRQLLQAEVHDQPEPEGLEEVEDEPRLAVQDAEQEEVAVEEVEASAARTAACGSSGS